MSVRAEEYFPLPAQVLIELFNSGELPNVDEIGVEPEYGYAARIVYKNGSVRCIRGTSLGINSLGASEVAKDKGYSKFFLEKLGYNTPKGGVFLHHEWHEKINERYSQYGVRKGRRFAEVLPYVRAEIGFPCFVKPNAGSQGRGISRCSDAGDLEAVIAEHEAADTNVLIVEEDVQLPDFRAVVLKTEVISCYLRTALFVVGDGASTVRELLECKQEGFKAEKRDTVIPVDDPRIVRRLEKLGLSLSSVPRRGEVVQIFDASNLSLGGSSEDYTDRIHQAWKDLCVNVTRDMGLVLCGVDLACSDVSDPASRYSILEINAAPGLDHYAAAGDAQTAIVRELYRKVFNDAD